MAPATLTWVSAPLIVALLLAGTSSARQTAPLALLVADPARTPWRALPLLSRTSPTWPL
jgi:hypothetical protein